MKIRKLTASVLAACCLAGCAVQPVGVEDLLRAPQLIGQRSSVQKALSSYLGEVPQLKYPKQSIDGAPLSPFLVADFNGDGRDDAAVLYLSAAKGQNVHLAILEQNNAGIWSVTQEKEGLAPSVESVSAAELQPGQGAQLLVGYGSPSGEKFLAVYSYRDSTLEEILTQPYSQYQLHPLAGSAASDLVIIGPEQISPLQLQLLTAQEGQFTLAQQLELDPQVIRCEGLYPSVGRNGSRFLVLDGYIGSGLASLILHYNRDLQKLETFEPLSGVDLFSRTHRFSPLLHSADIDGDGSVEIPCRVASEGAGTLTVNQLSLISWMDFTEPVEQEVRFGVADLEFGFFVSLPKEMKGHIMITGGEEPDSWQVRSLDGEKLYITVRVVDPEVQGDRYYRLGNIGAHKVQAKVATIANVSVGELSDGFYVL